MYLETKFYFEIKGRATIEHSKEKLLENEGTSLLIQTH